MTEFSLVIRNGTVFDGLGNPPTRRDIAIVGDRIAVIGDVPKSSAPTIDAAGLAVTPGFINVLSHSWQSIQVDGTCLSDLVQGVTTQVFGEGISLGPSEPALTSAVESEGLLPGARIEFARLSEGLDHLEAGGISPNIASFIGGHNLRALGAGLSDRALTPGELDTLRGIVDEEMAEGAIGIGTALIYAPGNFSTTEELTGLCEMVGRHDGLYISHLRSEGDRFEECLDELIAISADAECRAEVYHLKAGGTHNHHKMALAIERIQAARDTGQGITADMYPYVAGATALAAAIPPAYHAGGPEALLSRITDPTTRRDILEVMGKPDGDFENLFYGSDDGEGIMLLSDLADGTPTAGVTLRVAAEALAVTPAEALLRIVESDPTMLACYFMMSEENVKLGLSQPWVSIGSDAPAHSVADGSSGASTHPRAYGTFARILGHYARDLGLFSLSEAVRRMTSLPADTLRLVGRGRLEVDAFADVAIFDAALVGDRATYADPHRFATGMHHVVANGIPVLTAGVATEARPGRRLRRGEF